MEDEDKICPKCKGKMERGELVDESYMVSGAQKWAKYARGILGIGSSEGFEIVSFRCVECGYLENYATDTREKKSNAENLPFGYNR